MIAKEEWAQTDADDAGPFIRGRDSGYTAFELEIGEEQREERWVTGGGKWPISDMGLAQTWQGLPD